MNYKFAGFGSNTLLFSCFFLMINFSILFADGVAPSGTGSVEDPYLVETLDNLLWISTNPDSWYSNYIQTADINAAATRNWNDGLGFSPIGESYQNPFGSSYYNPLNSYNGQGHTIDSLYINRPEESYLGLFGYTFEATISNLSLTNVVINGNNTIGALVGMLDTSVVENCDSHCTINGNKSLGGLVGNCQYQGSQYPEITDSFSNSVISGNERLGGIMGNANSLTISRCSSVTTLIGESALGGLIGANFGTDMTDCYSESTLEGERFTGNLIGHQTNSNITNSFYNYDQCLLNGEKYYSVGAIYDAQYQDWQNNNLTLNPADYLVLDGEDYVLSSLDDFKLLLALGQQPELRFSLISDLDLSNDPNFFIPTFSSNLKGNNHQISNLNLDLPGIQSVGLFGYLLNASIDGIRLHNANITAKYDVGLLAGQCNGNVDISNCSSSGPVTGIRNVGGLAGSSDNGCTFNNCSSNAVVNCGGLYCNIAGGLIGVATYTDISECSADGVITSEASAAGLVGGSAASSIINCYSKSSVYGENYSSGFVLNLNNTEVNKCYSSGAASGNGENYGFIRDVGYNSSVTNSFWDMEASGQTNSAAGFGKTTEEMKSFATYCDLTTYDLEESWDFIDNPFDDMENEDIWMIDPNINDGYPSFVDAIVSSPEDELIEVNRLEAKIGNYPNPFNPATTINFQIPENYSSDNAKIEIYNVKGQKLKSFLITSSTLSPTTSVSWNGKDSNNDSISSGVYYSVLKLDGKIASSNKMLLIK